MSGNLPIVFKAKKNFDIEKFCQSLKDSFDFSCSGSGESRLCKLEFINLTIKIDKKSITIQGQLNKESREILSKLNTLEYLTLDQKNIKKYSEIF